MADKLKGLADKALAWWNKFTARQKTMIVSAAAGVIVAIAILTAILTRPQYVPLINCESTKQASEVKDLLTEAGIGYKLSDDGLQFGVLKEKQSDANLLLGANDIQALAYGIENVTDGGFSSTESDKQKKYKLYLESRLENDVLAKYNAIKSASVTLNIPEDSGTLIAQKEEAFASIVLELKDEFNQDNAAYLAKAIATGIGNKTTNNIVIMDTEGNMLFSGDDNYSSTGMASTQLSVKAQAETLVKNEVQKALMGTNQFDSVVVTSNISMDFSSVKKTTHSYTPAEGSTQGVLSSDSTFNSESINGAEAQAPGTDTNGDTEYMYQDNGESSSTTSEEKRNYLPNEEVISTDSPPGTIDYDASSVAVTAITYRPIREEDAKSQGLLDGITWEEYKLANMEKTPVTLDENMLDLVSKATGIPTDNIAIVAYSENMFLDSEGMNLKAADMIQIALIVVILGLLAFVVLRSMRGEKEPEQEEELSVETLLQSTPEEELENIEVEEINETKRVIDKFVDDNPEAAANLLRNWLNEDWG